MTGTRELRTWQLASVALHGVEAAAFMAALALAVFADPPAPYVFAAAAVLAAMLRHGVERHAARRLGIDARAAYAAVPLDERARRRTAWTLTLLAILAVGAGIATAIEHELAPVAAALTAAAFVIALDLGRVLRHRSYLALSRLVRPADVKRVAG